MIFVISADCCYGWDQQHGEQICSQEIIRGKWNLNTIDTIDDFYVIHHLNRLITVLPCTSSIYNLRNYEENLFSNNIFHHKYIISLFYVCRGSVYRYQKYKSRQKQVDDIKLNNERLLSFFHQADEYVCNVILHIPLKHIMD